MAQTLKDKTIKDLELMARKLKKRIAMLDLADIQTFGDTSQSIAILTSEYRSLKRDIIDLSNMGV